MMHHRLCAIVAALAIAHPAFCDTAYVKPSTFAPQVNQTLTLEAAFSDICCEPRHPVQAESYAVITPDGKQRMPDRIEAFSTMTVLEHTITQDGTTRFTTGERLGRKGEYVLLDGTYHLVNSPDAAPIVIPAGTPILTSQTATVSDAYVTAGPATWETVRFAIGRLRIEPVLHPNDVSTGAAFTARVTFDGAPVANQAIVLISEAQRLRGKDGQMARTDEYGAFSIVLSDPGIALLMTRLQAPAPDGAQTDIRSYTTSLTIEVSGN